MYTDFLLISNTTGSDIFRNEGPMPSFLGTRSWMLNNIFKNNCHENK